MSDINSDKVLSSAADQSNVEGRQSAQSDQLAITVNFPFWTAYRASLRIVLFSKLKILCWLILPLFALYLCYDYLRCGCPIPWYTGLLSLVLCVECPLLTLLSVYLIRRRNKLVRGATIFRFDADGVGTQGQAFTVSMPWSTFERVVETPRFMFFIISNRQMHILPIKDIVAVDQLLPLRTLAQQHLPYRLSTF